MGINGLIYAGTLLLNVPFMNLLNIYTGYTSIALVVLILVVVGIATRSDVVKRRRAATMASFFIVIGTLLSTNIVVFIP